MSGYGFRLLEFARRRYSQERFTLPVATFDERAIVVYERAGFWRGNEHETNGGRYLFISTARDA